jgi:hypothetical protein
MYVKLYKLNTEGRNPQPSYVPYNTSSCQFCRIIILRNGVANLGIKLYNKLPKKLEEIQEFKGKLKYFLLQHIFNSVDEYLSEYYQLFVTMHTFIILVFEYLCQRTY